MHLIFSIPFFNPEIIRAVSWTLVHSLWQGMLLSVIAGNIVFFTKNKTAALRYNLLTAALMLFIAGIAATFGILLTQAIPATLNQLAPAGVIPKDIQAGTILLTPENGPPLTGKITTIINAFADRIVLCWVLVIALQCLRLGGGLYGVYQLRKRQIFAPGEYWNERIVELSRRLSISRPVKLLQSGITGMPAVVGFLKPVILFPAGMLASLPPNEVEAILLHELAHIRRKDFIVNLLQQLVEIIFFFNPAIRWVSSLIRQERENCCDDIAVGQTHNKRNYINALMAFQELRQQPAALATAFGGEKKHLVNRVKRIIYNSNKTLNNMEKKLLATGLVITTLFIFAFVPQNEQQAIVKNTPARNYSVQVSALVDTIPGRDTTQTVTSRSDISRLINGKKYRVVAENNKIVAFYTNGKKVPAEKMAGYQKIISKVLQETKEEREASEADLENAEKMMEQSKADQEISVKEMVAARIKMEEAKAQMEQDMRQANKEMEETNKIMEESKKEIEQAKSDMEQAMKGYKADKQSNEAMELAKKNMERAKADMEKTKKQVQQAKNEVALSMLQVEASRAQMEQSKKDMEASAKLQENIVDDLVKESIIKDKKELSSFKLNSESLIVNGVKQPDAVHKRFEDKYVKNDHWSVSYNYNYNDDVK